METVGTAMLTKISQCVAVYLLIALNSVVSAAPYDDFVSSCSNQFNSFDKRVAELTSLGWEKVGTPMLGGMLENLAMYGMAVKEMDGIAASMDAFFDYEKRKVLDTIEMPQNSFSQSGIMMKQTGVGFSTVLLRAIGDGDIQFSLTCRFATANDNRVREVEASLDAQGSLATANRYRYFVGSIPDQTIGDYLYSTDLVFFFYSGSAISTQSELNVSSDFSASTSTFIQEK